MDRLGGKDVRTLLGHKRERVCHCRPCPLQRPYGDPAFLQHLATFAGDQHPWREQDGLLGPTSTPGPGSRPMLRRMNDLSWPWISVT